MQNPILKFAEFFLDKMLDAPELQAVVGTRIYNSSAPPGAALPFAVFTIVPLQDNVGQARRSIQTRLMCDFKIHFRLPVNPLIGDAVEAAKEKFKTTRTAHSFGEFRLSVWCERPISTLNSGAVVQEKIYVLGETFRATMSRVETSVVRRIPFFASTGAAANVAFAPGGQIPFFSRAGAENNIAPFSGKIPFIDRAGQFKPIEPV